MTLGLIALSLLFMAFIYPFAYWSGYREGRIDGRLEEQAEQESAEHFLEATEVARVGGREMGGAA